MLVKKDVILLAIMVGLFLIAASWPYLSYKIDNPTSGITGNSISEAAKTFYDMSSVSNRILILLQIFLFIIVIAFVSFIFRRSKKRVILSKKDYIAKDGNRRSRTDLDILYGILKIKKAINIDDIARTFKVSPEIALGWSKVLETGDLAEIDYPRFGNPVLKIPEEEEKKNEEGKENDGVETIKDAAPKIKGKRKVVKKVRSQSRSLEVKRVKRKTRKKVVVRKSVSSKKRAKASASSSKKVAAKKKIVRKGKKR